MNRTQLPAPPGPNPDMVEWQRAAIAWMAEVKGRIETDSRANTLPMGPFQVGTYTAVSTVTGTDALSNFVATLLTAMQAQGYTAANIQRTTT